MKKIICIILLIVLSFIFCGCSINEDKFPQLEICRSEWRADSIHIALRDNYNFNIQHLYEEVETKDGYDIIIHIIKNKQEINNAY